MTVQVGGLVVAGGGEGDVIGKWERSSVGVGGWAWAGRLQLGLWRTNGPPQCKVCIRVHPKLGSHNECWNFKAIIAQQFPVGFLEKMGVDAWELCVIQGFCGIGCV